MHTNVKIQIIIGTSFYSVWGLWGWLFFESFPPLHTNFQPPSWFDFTDTHWWQRAKERKEHQEQNCLFCFIISVTVCFFCVVITLFDPFCFPGLSIDRCSVLFGSVTSASVQTTQLVCKYSMFWYSLGIFRLHTFPSCWFLIISVCRKACFTCNVINEKGSVVYLCWHVFFGGVALSGGFEMQLEAQLHCSPSEDQEK